jgi:anti-sigma factor RsiW
LANFSGEREDQKTKKYRKQKGIAFMKTDDIQLMAYADGTLSPHEREQINARIHRSVKTAIQVTRLQASRLPYREAFAHQKLPSVPQRLIEKITEMVAAAAETGK